MPRFGGAFHFPAVASASQSQRRRSQPSAPHRDREGRGAGLDWSAGVGVATSRHNFAQNTVATLPRSSPLPTRSSPPPPPPPPTLPPSPQVPPSTSLLPPPRRRTITLGSGPTGPWGRDAPGCSPCAPSGDGLRSEGLAAAPTRPSPHLCGSLAVHVFSEQSGRCINCGTWKGNPARTICPHSAADAKAARPEPSRHQYAVYDQATIAARLIELRTEREMSWNTTEEETG